MKLELGLFLQKVNKIYNNGLMLFIYKLMHSKSKCISEEKMQ